MVNMCFLMRANIFYAGLQAEIEFMLELDPMPASLNVMKVFQPSGLWQA